MLNKESPTLTYAETLHPDHTDAVEATELVAIDEENPSASHNNRGNGEASASNNDEPETSCDRFNCIVIAIGWSFIVASVASTYAMEGACAILYMLAYGFWHISEKAKDFGVLGLLFRLIFSLLSTLMLLIDAMMLYLSTFLTELLAFLCRLLCTLFGGCSAGNQWHQTIRKECHQTRIGFRSLFKDWTSPRGQPCGKNDCKSTEGNSTQQSDTGAVGTIAPLPSKKDHTTASSPPATNPNYQEDQQDAIIVAMEDVQIIDDGDAPPESSDRKNQKQDV